MRIASLVLALLLVGCSANKPRNPSFNVTMEQAKAALRHMERHPRPLKRPVLVLSGYMDPGFAAGSFAVRLRNLTGDSRIQAIAFAFCRDFDECRRRVIETVEEHFPSDDPDWTTEVDVVAISMGGVVGRYAAMDITPPATSANNSDDPLAHKRLKVARMFTIASPHRGAPLADLPTFDRVQIDMRMGSTFIESLEPPNGDYELYAYVRLGDRTVGPANAAPPGQTPWWVARPFPSPAHAGAFTDARIIADVARRLRGETAFATHPPSPLP